MLASCAIPAAFPPVRIGERYLIDGAVASNTPISVAVELGAKRVVVLLDRLRLVPPLCPLAVSPYDFSHAGEMIERAAGQTQRWLDKGGLTRKRVPGAPRGHTH